MGFYIVVFGKIVLHNKALGAIGMATIGDFLGEEMLFERVTEGKNVTTATEKV